MNIEPAEVQRALAAAHPGMTAERLAGIGRAATWRGTTFSRGLPGFVAFSLDTEVGIERFVLDVHGARRLAESLALYLKREGENV